MTLYLKYRPQTIEELDSEKVRTQLMALISSNRLPHAFLFSGPKGVGKTSTARILAKVINCEKNKEKLGEPCNTCDYCLGIVKGSNFDVIEMDAASNRGIDDIRSLREKIVLSPGSAHKKIYIIDEVHMLTTEAFNALLKTLEEPPAHVVFILATTDPQKLPETVRSRLVNIIFEKAKDTEIVRQLHRVAKGEKVKVEDNALLLIAQAADGAFRDAVKIFEELLINLTDLTSEKVGDYLFKNKLLDAKSLLTLLAQSKLSEALGAIEEFVAKGGSLKTLIGQTSNLLHGELLIKLEVKEGKSELDFSVSDIEKLTTLLNIANNELSQSVIPQLPLELAIIKFLNLSTPAEEPKKKVVDTPPPKKVESAPVQKVEAPKKDEMPIVSVESQPETNLSELTPFTETTWFKLLQLVRTKNATIEAFMRAAKPFGMDEEGLVIGVYYRFHKEQLEVMNNRRIIEDCMAEVHGQPVRVRFVITEKVDSKPSLVSNLASPGLTTSGQQDIIDAAKEIFGG